MKKNLLILFILILTALIIMSGISCKKMDESTIGEATDMQQITANETTEEESAADEFNGDKSNTSNINDTGTTVDESTETGIDSSIEQEDVGQLVDYSITVNGNIIALRDWDYRIHLYEILGTPISEEIRELGLGSDTFTGCFVKTMKYEGLEIELFSPPDNGVTFWICSIKVTGDLYPTSRGIRVGDSLETLKNAYPSITKVLDGRTDDNNCAYEIADRESYLFMQFEIKDGVIQYISIYYTIP
jgi:hypothetical protein